ncbi:unnamed protein product [Penicillium salamii]|nr:unnamed protein product [Penicillium salamii]
MHILSPYDDPPVNPVDHPQIAVRTLSATFQKLHDFGRSCPDGIDKCDLSAILIEAIKLNRLKFSRELLHRGLPMDSLYAIEATEVKAKDVIEVLLDNRRDIYQPKSELQPPVLG